MQQIDSPFPIVNSHGRLKCKEILGGIRDRDIEVSAGKAIASIYSSACCGEMGGDIYYFGVCKGDIITRLAIAYLFPEFLDFFYDLSVGSAHGMKVRTSFLDSDACYRRGRFWLFLQHYCPRYHHGTF